jgi:hypothetical protein
MSPRRDDPAAVDLPEPEDVLTGSGARTGDHLPADGDDRTVPLDEPASTEPPIDDDEPS